jgi:histidinol-phosphate phosphatase family protein
MMRQAVILAGGTGTRLRERLKGLPKPLVNIGGVTLMEHQVLLAKRHGLDRLLVLVNYAAERIIEFCAERRNWGITIECIDDGEPLGTAGAVLGVFDRLDNEFLVIYGDTMLGVDLTRFCAFHRSLPDPAATLLTHPNDHPHDSDLVETDEDLRITAFHPYPHKPGHVYPNLVNAALYAVRKSALAPWLGHRSPLDFGKDLFPDMLQRGLPLFAYNSPEYIKDCGTPERLDRVCCDFAAGRIARASLDVPQPAVFLDRDGTINAHVGFVVRPDQLELIPGSAKAIGRLNRSDYRTVVITNQPVIARGDCTIEELRRIHSCLEGMLSAGGAYLDRLCYCPHHPDRGYPGERAELKIACTCRKPNTGLIDRAAAELNVARDRSWMVGDSTSDMLVASRAGLKSILVETGEAGRDAKYPVSPDFVAPDLAAAVDFILDEYPSLSALCDEIAASVSPGQLVFIGGLSRSGKTTLANGLRIALQGRGQRAIVLGADRWLLSEGDRGPGVFGRYDLAAMTRRVATLADRRQLVEMNLPIYDRFGRRHSDVIEPLIVGRDDVVIFEGTVALKVASELHSQHHLYFVQTDEARRRSRILREYRLRGCTPAQSEAIYSEREEDETPVIMATAAIAQRRITLPAVAGGKQADGQPPLRDGHAP